MNNRLIRIVGVLCLLLFGGWKVPNVANCEEIVKMYFAKSRELSSPAKGKTYYLEADMNTINKPTSRQEDVNTRMKFIINSKNFQYESDLVSIYEDKVYSYTIIHTKKLVIKNRSIGEKAKAMQISNFTGMQNAMLEYAQSTVCNELTGKNGEKILEVKMQINQDGQEVLKAKQVVLYLTKESFVIQKSVVYFIDSHPIYTQTVNFRKISNDFKEYTAISPEKALFDKNGKFKRKYQGYTLVDNSQNVQKK